jgi:hypothetical protein
MVTVHRPQNGKWKIAVYGGEGRHTVPHYHVEGPGFRCSVDVTTGEVIIGDAPKRGPGSGVGLGGAQAGNAAEHIQGAELMSEKLRTLKAVKAVAPTSLDLSWADGEKVRVDLAEVFGEDASGTLANRKMFESARVGDWGHSVVWSDGTEISADRLWLETLSKIGRPDVREFLEWRIRNALPLSKAAAALHLSRRMVAYYSSGKKEVPPYVLLACHGWEDLHNKAEAGRESEHERELAELVA